MLSKRRAAAMVIAGMIFTWPAQIYLAGPAAAIWVMVRAARAPVVADG